MARNKRNAWGNSRDIDESRDEASSFQKYRDNLMQLGMAMFDWQDLPDTCNERYIEKTEYFRGATIFFKDDTLGFLCLPVIFNGPFDVMDEPNRRVAYSRSGYRKELDKDNSVIIWNNYLRKPSCLTVNHYARRLADIENSIDVNCKAQKTPVLIRCSENQRLTLENLYQKYEGNYPFIFGEKDLDVKGISAIVTGAPFVSDKMFQIKMQIWNEALTELGISNISYQKKERLVSDEVIRNMGGTIASRYSRITMRRLACDKINDMFSLDIKCDYREDFRQTDDENMILGESEIGEKANIEPMVTDLRTR